MGVLANPNHERFCQEVHRRILTRETRGAAQIAAYREHIYTGADATDAQIAPNARRLAQQKHIKARISEIQEFAAKLAGIDQAWGLVKLKGFVEANLDDYLTPPDANGNRYFNIGAVPPEKLALLSELSQEEERIVGDEEEPVSIRKVKLKFHDRIAALTLMARIAGWLAPEKQEHTITGLGDRLDRAIQRTNQST